MDIKYKMRKEFKKRQLHLCKKGQHQRMVRGISESSITLQAMQEVREIHLVDYFFVATMRLGSKSYSAGQPLNLLIKWHCIGGGGVSSRAE